MFGTQTVGTKTAAWLNIAGALLGLLQSTDFIHIIGGGPAAGYVMLGVTAANAILHTLTGTQSVLAKSS